MVVPCTIRLSPANWPALVRLVRDIRPAEKASIPKLEAMIPKVKDTLKYPKTMGMESFVPSKKSLRITLVLYHISQNVV